ncbi:MAG: RidA family protein [Terricaulis sp.]|jgi:enamine deaminase RidA (YjgF/YER057c/UK114 family)|nr:RidA family protein [Hyphomonadaceae bacterium]
MSSLYARRSVIALLASAALVHEAEAQVETPARYRSPEQRLRELGIVLPDPPRPVATYAPFRRAGRTLYLAGLGPANLGGVAARGRVGAELNIEQGYAAARAAGLNVLSLLRSACGGSLDRVTQCLRVGAFVASADDFHDQPRVANGASDLFVEVFGQAGLHARFAVGVNTLPFDIPVEIESIWQVRS